MPSEQIRVHHFCCNASHSSSYGALRPCNISPPWHFFCPGCFLKHFPRSASRKGHTYLRQAAAYLYTSDFDHIYWILLLNIALYILTQKNRRHNIRIRRFVPSVKSIPEHNAPGSFFAFSFIDHGRLYTLFRICSLPAFSQMKQDRAMMRGLVIWLLFRITR